MHFYTVSFNGHRSSVIKASDACDAATASALRKYTNKTIRVTPATNGKIVWNISEADTGTLLGFCAVHKPKDQRALYLRHKAEQEQKLFCNECGHKSDPSDVFCSECGTKFV